MFGTALYTLTCVVGSCWAYREFGCFKNAVDRVLNLWDPPDGSDEPVDKVEERKKAKNTKKEKESPKG